MPPGRRRLCPLLRAAPGAQAWGIGAAAADAALAGDASGAAMLPPLSPGIYCAAPFTAHAARTISRLFKTQTVWLFFFRVPKRGRAGRRRRWMGRVDNTEKDMEDGQQTEGCRPKYLGRCARHGASGTAPVDSDKRLRLRCMVRRAARLPLAAWRPLGMAA